jgi:hypothetical protein
MHGQHLTRNISRRSRFYHEESAAGANTLLQPFGTRRTKLSFPFTEIRNPCVTPEPRQFTNVPGSTFKRDTYNSFENNKVVVRNVTEIWITDHPTPKNKCRISSAHFKQPLDRNFNGIPDKSCISAWLGTPNINKLFECTLT